MFVTFFISIVKDRHIHAVFYALSMQDRPTFGVLSNQGLCQLCSVATTTENFSETKFRKKKSKFLVYGKSRYHTIFIYGKMLIIEFSYNFLYVWNCMKLYDKKFLIYGNYMIRSFGQPGDIGRFFRCFLLSNRLLVFLSCDCLLHDSNICF